MDVYKKEIFIMKKSHKVPLIVLSIISALIIISAFVFTFLLSTLLGSDIDLGMNIFEVSFNLLKESYVATFTSAEIPTMLTWYGTLGGAKFCMALSIVQWVFSSIMVALFIFGFIYVCCKKRPGSIAVQFLFLLAAFDGAFFIAFGPLLLGKFTEALDLGSSKGAWILIILILAVLGFILAFVTYILDLAFVSVSSRQKKQEEQRAQIVHEAPVQEAEEIQEEPEVVPEPEPAKEDPQDLAAMLRELVRDMVKDEMARQPQQQAYNGPLVVQYFGSAPAPAPVEEKKPEPQPEPEPEPVVEPEPQPEPEPVVEPVPEPEAEPEKPKYERLTFTERLLQSEDDVLNLYNEVKNEILSWGVKSRISANGDTFRLHKKMYVRITVAGKSLKLYFALDPKDYENTTLPIQDASNKDMYQEIPLVFKVKSGLSLRRCKDLIQDVMEKDGLEQGEVGKVNWVNELRAHADEQDKDDED